MRVLCVFIAVLAFGQQPAAVPSPEQTKELTALADQVKALIQAGNLREASRQSSQLTTAIYRITTPVLPSAEEQFQRAEQLLRPDPSTRFFMLSHVAQRALNAGHLDKAEAYGRELQGLAPQFSTSPYYGTALHYARLMIGRVALQRDHNLALAKASLLEAARVPATETLQKFGPNMALARDLLSAGERDTVLEYLDLSRSLWPAGAAKLDDWAALIKAGGIPDFGANLIYS